MAIPYTFATESGAVQASQLDANFTYVLNNTVSVNEPNVFTMVQTMLGAPFDEGKGANIASASTLNLETMTGNYAVVSGTATITAITLNSGAVRRVRATGAFTINNNSLIKVQGGSNYTAAVGDLFLIWGDDSGITYVIPFSATSTPGGVQPVSLGGTGLSSGTSGGILGFTASGTIASSAALTQHAVLLGGGVGSTPSALGSLGTTTTVLHGNASGDPSFSAVSLISDVSGTLAVANGGTGVTSSTGTGSTVLSNTPTLVTPVIGAATGTSTSVTGLHLARSGTATPAAASAVAAFAMGSAGVGLYWGTGDPNTSLTAPKGSLFLRTDGSSTSTRIYVNTDASTAWTNVTTAA